MKAKAHILVIRLSAMGDVAMTVPVLLALTQQYPQLKITVLTRSFFAPIFAQLPNVTIFEADVKGKHKGLFGLWKLYKTLKRLRFDAVADLHNVLRSTILKQFFRLDGIPFFQINKGRSDKKALTAISNKRFEQLKTTHQRYVDVFTKLGYSINLDKVALLQKETQSEKSLKLIGTDVRKWIGIAPFAAYDGKTYPLDQMKTVVETLKTKGDYKIILFGGGTIEKELLAQFSDEKNCINTVGQLNFKEELTLISNLDLMLAMDSGNAHLAAMYNIPTVTLWGVTHPYAGFAPFKQELNTLVADRKQFPMIPTSVYGNKAPEGYKKAIASISPSSIVQKVQSLL